MRKRIAIVLGTVFLLLLAGGALLLRTSSGVRLDFATPARQRALVGTRSGREAGAVTAQNRMI